jgi:hypothetical protein
MMLSITDVLGVQLFRQLWTWFILPACGVATPGFLTVMGASLMLSLATGASLPSSLRRAAVDKGEPELSRNLPVFIMTLVTYVFILAIGFALHLFM